MAGNQTNSFIQSNALEIQSTSLWQEVLGVRPNRYSGSVSAN